MLKFSIIIPAYNAESTIEKCIRSVIEQTYNGWEIIVINDGSNDNTHDILEKLLPSSCIISTENMGVSAARNKGIELAKGDYILFLDADDYLPKDTLRIYYENILAEEYPELVFGSFYKVYPQKRVLCNPYQTKSICEFKDGRIDFNPFKARLAGTVWGKCYKSTLINSKTFDSELALCEDAEFNYRIFKCAKRMLYINEPVYEYVYNKDSTIRRYNATYIDKYTRAIERIINENKEEVFYSDILEFAFSVFSVICFNVILTSNNKRSYKTKREDFLELSTKSIFKDVIELVDISKMQIKYRVVVFVARNRFFCVLYSISLLYRIVNKLLY